jgi:hypothetical protein
MSDRASLSDQGTSGPLVAVVTLVRSWDFDPRAAGQRAVIKHADALRRLAT